LSQAIPEKRQIAWLNAIFLTVSPIVAVASAVWYVQVAGWHVVDLALFWFLYWATGMSITGGYHRLYSHRSYTCHPAIEWFYLLFGAASFQNAVLYWARDHRLHHKYVDTDGDPYNINRGGLWAHMGWIYFVNPEDDNFTTVPDLLRNPRVMFQHRHYKVLGTVVGLLAPTLIGAMFGRALGGFIFGGLLRIVVVHHLTFFINSLAHMVGKQPYSDSDTARDCWWLAYLTYGEGYHNFHHRFPVDYRNGVRWFHFDPGKWLVWSLEKVGLVYRKSRLRDQQILRARLEMDARRARRVIEHLPEATVDMLERKLAEARDALEAAAEKLAETRKRYAQARQHLVADSRRLREELRNDLRKLRAELDEALARWSELTSGHGLLAAAELA